MASGDNGRDPGQDSLRVQLWSYNYDPEPTGIAPVSTVLAQGLKELGHRVDVVAAHPHYPEPKWGNKLLPYRETRDGIDVLRLPLWIGRETAGERYRQELTFMAAQTLATPALPPADVLVSASPSFPALLPAILNSRARKLPWILWLHDILPDGAAVTGLVDSGFVLNSARRLERAAYRAADRIVVLSEAFTANLAGKGVTEDKISLIYDPATRQPRGQRAEQLAQSPPLRVLSMGNIGYSQGLAPLVAAFEQSPELREHEVELVITGNGVAADEVRAQVETDRVKMLGVVSDDALEHELRAADVAFVSQQYEGAEFNIPSKLMNFMAYGLPVLAAVNPSSEVARLVEAADGGWVVDSSDPPAFPRKVAELAGAADEVRAKGQASLRYAEQRFTQQGFSREFERVLGEVARGGKAGAAAPAAAR